MKTVKKVPLFYDNLQHLSDQRDAHQTSVLFNKAVAELETIIKKPIEDYKAFKNDILGYSLEMIKQTFPKPFELGLDNEATLKMLGINLSNINSISEKIQNTTHRYTVCKKTGVATPCNDKEPYTKYAETPEQFERLKFSNDIIAISEKAFELGNNLHKSDLVYGFKPFVVYDTQKGLIPNWYFVVNGIQ
jgi:hypothetical protein